MNFEKKKNPHKQWNILYIPQLLFGTSPLIFNIKISGKKNSEVDSVLLMSQVRPTTLNEND